MIYVDYVLNAIIADVERIPTIYDNCQWYSWIFVIAFWIMWIGMKNMLLLLPIFLFWNITLGSGIKDICGAVRKRLILPSVTTSQNVKETAQPITPLNS